MRQYFLLILVLLLSCNSEKHLARKEQKKLQAAKAVFANHPHEFAADCGRQFPPKITDSVSHTVKPGTTTIVPVSADDDITGYIIAAVAGATEQTRDHIIDSFKKHPYVIKIKCPDQTVHAPDTVLDTRYVTVENTATLDALQFEIKHLSDSISSGKQKIADLQDSKKTWRGTALKAMGGCGLLLLVIIIAIVLKITGKLKFL